MLGVLLMEPCVGAEGSLTACPLLPSPLPLAATSGLSGLFPCSPGLCPAPSTPSWGWRTILGSRRCICLPNLKDRWARPGGLCVAKITGARVAVAMPAKGRS